MINLTIVSSTNRTIEVQDLHSLNETIGYTNQEMYIPYSDYVLRLTDINTNLSSSVFQITSNKITNDVIFIAVIGVSLLCILFALKYLRRV